LGKDLGIPNKIKETNYRIILSPDQYDPGENDVQLREFQKCPDTLPVNTATTTTFPV